MLLLLFAAAVATVAVLQLRLPLVVVVMVVMAIEPGGDAGTNLRVKNNVFLILPLFTRVVYTRTTCRCNSISQAIIFNYSQFYLQHATALQSNRSFLYGVD